MTKLEFLTSLSSRLAMLGEEERQKTLDYYSEMIDDRLEEGMSEEEAIAGLEPVEDIAREILCDQPLPDLLRARANSNAAGTKRYSALQITLIVIGFPIWFPLLLAGAMVVLALYAVIWSLIIAVFAVVAALGISALFGVVLGFFMIVTQPASCLLAVGGGLFCAGLCIFAFYGAQRLAIQLIRLTVKLGRGIKSLIIRKERS